jgi:hypothetical protein
VIFSCCLGRRAELVRLHAVLNGIEFLEVLDEDAPAGSPRQRTLLVRCYKPVTGLDADNVRIEGGTRVRPVGVNWAFPADEAAGQGVLNADEAAFMAALDDPAQVLVVRTDVFGDFSTYTLRLVAGPGLPDPPADYDPVLSQVEFSFKAECPTPFDCLAPRSCPPAPRESPLINYLAKDYGTLRQALLDRMALLLPGWNERHAADLGVALVEVLAYVGDSLSYEQDAIATEAYLHTARLRVSARRHARLVDYFMHDGANARAWVQIDAAGVTAVPEGTPFLTRGAPLLTAVVAGGSAEYLAALRSGAEVFESMQRVVVYPQNNTMRFYTWQDEACALPKGATRATLRDGDTPTTRLLLRANDVLVFEEVKGPGTGNPADADPTRRHAVRLTKVDPQALAVLDAYGAEIGRTPDAAVIDPLTEPPVPGQAIVHIEWHAEDALPFPLCISSPRTDTELADQVFADVSVARGNVLLADHGRRIAAAEVLEGVPSPSLFSVVEGEPVFCAKEEEHPILPRYRPELAERPVTQVGHVLAGSGAAAQLVRFDPEGSAASAFAWELRRALPAAEATSDGTESWSAQRDLLDSRPEDRHFVVEVDADGFATLRFGDGEHGRRPQAGSTFTASYRVGNGRPGNVGREAIAHVVDPGPPFVATAVAALRNPLPARGGVDPETIEEVRQKAPYAFRTQERAVTTGDYVAAALRRPELQGAAARFRWTGSWRTVFVTLDPLCRDTRDPIAGLTATVRDHLEKFRMAGYDLVVDDPIYVSLEIALHVCVKPGYFASDVERTLREVFSSGFQSDGSKGLFHADRFEFGEPVYVSPLLQAALAVDGVHDVRFLTFQRMGQPDQGQALAEGRIELGRYEIARLENDPSFPEHGVFDVTLEGSQ